MGLYWDTHIISTIYISYDMGICETISVIISNIQYITLISYAHFVWLISIHFPASLRNKNTARTWHHQARGRLFPCSNAPQADLQLSWRQKIGVQACWEAAVNIREPWGLLSTKSVFSDRPGWLISSVGHSQGLCWGAGGMVNPSFLLVKKAVHEKIWKNKVCSGSIDSKKNSGAVYQEMTCLRSSWKIKVFSGSLDATKSSGAVYQEMGSNIMDLSQHDRYLNQAMAITWYWLVGLDWLFVASGYVQT